jgi:hypothetical protein
MVNFPSLEETPTLIWISIPILFTRISYLGREAPEALGAEGQDTILSSTSDTDCSSTSRAHNG